MHRCTTQCTDAQHNAPMHNTMHRCIYTYSSGIMFETWKFNIRNGYVYDTLHNCAPSEISETMKRSYVWDCSASRYNGGLITHHWIPSYFPVIYYTEGFKDEPSLCRQAALGRKKRTADKKKSCLPLCFPGIQLAAFYWISNNVFLWSGADTENMHPEL